MLLEISQNSQENTCGRVSFLIKLQLKKRLWHRCFPVNFARFLRTPFLQNTSGRLLLKQVMLNYILVIYPNINNSFPSRHLLVQSQQEKHRDNVWNLFKINNKNTRATSLTSFCCLLCNCERISHIVLEFVLLTLNN